MKKKVVCWRPMYDRSGMQQLADRGFDVVVVDSSEPAEIAAALGDADALWARYPEQVTAHVLDAGRGSSSSRVRASVPITSTFLTPPKRGSSSSISVGSDAFPWPSTR